MRNLVSLAVAVSLLAIVGCRTDSSEPIQDQPELQAKADTALSDMKAREPDLAALLDKSAGYAVFPEIGKAGAVVGGAYGHGVVYKQGKAVGYVDLTQASLGAQLGGETFSELIVFENDTALNKLMDGSFDLGGQASVVALDKGVRGSTFGDDGTIVVVDSKQGLMVDLSVAGQKLDFHPRG